MSSKFTQFTLFLNLVALLYINFPQIVHNCVLTISLMHAIDSKVTCKKGRYVVQISHFHAES